MFTHSITKMLIFYNLHTYNLMIPPWKFCVPKDVAEYKVQSSL